MDFTEWGKSWVAWFMLIILVGSLCFVTGLFEIGYARIIGVEKENTRREIFKHSNAYIDGKEAEALKLYREYRAADDKKSVEAVVRMSFKDFDENELSSPELVAFVKQCKY